MLETDVALTVAIKMIKTIIRWFQIPLKPSLNARKHTSLNKTRNVNNAFHFRMC